MKRISPTIFGLALMCFLLPWINVSCQGQKVVSLTGVNLVAGTTVSDPSISGYAKNRRVAGETLAVVMLVVVVAGCMLSFAKGKLSNAGPAVSGASGVVLLIMLRSKLNNDILAQGGGMLTVNCEIGFYLMFLLFLSAIAANSYFIMQSNGLVSGQGTGVQPAAAFCSECGALADSVSKFCSECGRAIK